MNDRRNAITRMLNDRDAGFGAFLILVLMVVSAIVVYLFS